MRVVACCWSFSDHFRLRRTLTQSWAAGEVDVQIKHAPSNPQMWTPVRTLLRARKDEADRISRAAAEERLAAAQARAECTKEGGQSQLELWTATAQSAWNQMKGRAEELIARARELISKDEESKAADLRQQAQQVVIIVFYKRTPWMVMREELKESERPLA